MNRRGMSLVETLVALAIVAVAGTAVISLTLSILAANNAARRRNQAINYTEQALEQVRSAYQTTSWVQLAAKGSSGGICYGDVSGAIGSWPIGPCNRALCDNTGGTLIGTNIWRYVMITTAGSQVRVQSVVLWLDRGVCRSTEANTYFYNY